jgi:transcriptional regulator with XRE-family HTH domain
MNKKSYDFGILRFIRKQRGQTIETLAKNSGVSFAAISKLERNQGNPGLDTIKQLGQALGLSASELVAMAEMTPHEVKKEECYRSDGFEFRRTSFNNVKIMCATAKKGSCVSKPEVHEDDTEIVFVREGKIRLSMPAGDRVLTRGESIQFDAVFSHAYEALTDCDIFILHIRKEKRF